MIHASSAPVLRSARLRRRAGMRTEAGFTLIEIVIVLTIIAVLAAATLPTFRGLAKERQAREPIAELARMAKEARLRAMKEKKAYQVVLSSTGFTVSRYFDPYLDFAGLNEFLTENESLVQEALTAAGSGGGEPAIDGDEETATSAPAGSTAAAPGAPTFTTMQDIIKAQNTVAAANEPTKTGPKAEWAETYKLPPGTTYSVQYWHETIPTPIDGEVVKLWVFQPSGICEPIKLQLANEVASFKVEFSALTGDVVREISDIK